MFFGTVLGMLLLYGRNDGIVGGGCTVIMFIQTAMLLLPVIDTEKELRRQFKADGSRRQKEE